MQAGVSEFQRTSTGYVCLVLTNMLVWAVGCMAGGWWAAFAVGLFHVLFVGTWFFFRDISLEFAGRFQEYTWRRRMLWMAHWLWLICVGFLTSIEDLNVMAKCAYILAGVALGINASVIVAMVLPMWHNHGRMGTTDGQDRNAGDDGGGVFV